MKLSLRTRGPNYNNHGSDTITGMYGVNLTQWKGLNIHFCDRDFTAQLKLQNYGWKKLEIHNVFGPERSVIVYVWPTKMCLWSISYVVSADALVPFSANLREGKFVVWCSSSRSGSHLSKNPQTRGNSAKKITFHAASAMEVAQLRNPKRLDLSHDLLARGLRLQREVPPSRRGSHQPGVSVQVLEYHGPRWSPA